MSSVADAGPQVWAQMVRALADETHVPLGLHLNHRQVFSLTANGLRSGSGIARTTVQATAPPLVQPLHFPHLPQPADHRPEVPPSPTAQE